jgi:sugar phosphate isomerase/epimerase
MKLIATIVALIALVGGTEVPPALLSAAPVQPPGALPISAQLYTVRNAGTLDEQLAMVAAAGIKFVEPFRFAGMKEPPAAEFKALLDKHGLKVSGMHVNIGALIEETDRIAEYNKTIGNTRLIVPALPASITPKDKAGWQAMGRLFASLAETFKKHGMQVGFHNHAVELEVYDGKTGLEWFAQAAGPDVIFTVDVAWAARGGQDPAALLDKMKGHVWNIHAKDNAPTGTAADERGFATLGKGTVDWDKVLPAAKAAGAIFYTLEHDQPKDAALVLKEGNAYLTPRLQKLLTP